MTFTEIAVEQIKAKNLLSKDSDYDGAIGKSLVQLLQLFQRQRHSGMSAQITADLFHRLIKNSGYFSKKEMVQAYKKKKDEKFVL